MIAPFAHWHGAGLRANSPRKSFREIGWQERQIASDQQDLVTIMLFSETEGTLQGADRTKVCRCINQYRNRGEIKLIGIANSNSDQIRMLACPMQGMIKKRFPGECLSRFAAAHAASFATGGNYYRWRCIGHG